MSKPHPKGPRSFQNLFEADRHPARSKPASGPERTGLPGLSPVSFTITESTAMSQAIPIEPNPRPLPIPVTIPNRGIDLTAFAGRFLPSADPSGAGFELPPRFFQRLNALRPTDRAPSFATHPVALDAPLLATMAAK